MEQPVGTGASSPLDDSRRRLEAVLDNATVSIFLMDDRQHCIYMNRAAEHLTGFSFEEVLSLDKPLHDIVHHTRPDGRPFPLSDCAIDRAFPEHNQMQGEEVFVHKDGSFYPVAFTASPVRDELSHTVGTIIEVRDIREQKAAEERQRLLLSELDHRVKNTLATIHSLVWQTFKDASGDSMQRFEGRLAALSRAHNILTASAWHSASMQNIVEEAVQAFGHDRIRAEGPDCELHSKAAVTLSMVLHELGTNALKYGALSTRRGQVRLNWTCEEQDGALVVHLTWQESGGPPVKPPSRTGFGSRLIQRQLGLELGGGATLDFRPEGLVCTIDMRVPKPREPLELGPLLAVQ